MEPEDIIDELPAVPAGEEFDFNDETAELDFERENYGEEEADE